MRIHTLLIALLIGSTGFSQEFPGKLDKKTILIGEMNGLTLDASNLNNTFNWPSQLALSAIRQTKEGFDTIDIEVLRLVLDSLRPKQLRIEFTAWDTGVVTLLPITLTLPDSVTFDPQLIWVRLPDFNPEGDILDIEAGEIFIDGPWFDWPWWVWMFIGLGVLGIVAYIIYLKRKKQPVSAPERVLTLTEKTHARMHELFQRKLWIKGEQKVHFVELTDILRNYIHLRYGIETAEKTTRELNLALRSINVPANHIEIVTQILQQADMVKFAKFKPLDEEVEVINQQCLNWVVLTEDKEELSAHE
jgi:hypothetical protein